MHMMLCRQLSRIIFLFLAGPPGHAFRLLQAAFTLELSRIYFQLNTFLLVFLFLNKRFSLLKRRDLHTVLSFLLLIFLRYHLIYNFEFRGVEFMLFSCLILVGVVAGDRRAVLQD